VFKARPACANARAPAISKKQRWSFAMAKRTRASARGKPASKKSTCPPKTAPKTALKSAPKTALKTSKTKNANLARRLVLTPELLTHARHLYEATAASLAKIAVDVGIHRRTLTKLAEREGWLRYVRPPRGLPRALKLKAQASELEDQVLSAAAATSGPSSENEKPLLLEGEGPAVPPLTDTVERLYRAVREELAAVETLRAQLKREPQSPQDAERTARTLSSLTETLQKLQRLQCAVPQSGSYDDDMPADIDEFRRELARRIEAFVASRSGAGDDGGSGSAALDAAAR
jgi:hypothetical protein